MEGGPDQELQACIWGQQLAPAATFLSRGLGWVGGCAPKPEAGGPVEGEREKESPPGAVTSAWSFLLDRCKVKHFNKKQSTPGCLGTV